MDTLHIKLKLNISAIEWYLYIIIYNELENISSKEYKNSHLFPSFFFSLDNTVIIIYKLFKFSLVILDIIMEGTVSQIAYLGISYLFM